MLHDACSLSRVGQSVAINKILFHYSLKYLQILKSPDVFTNFERDKNKVDFSY